MNAARIVSAFIGCLSVCFAASAGTNRLDHPSAATPKPETLNAMGNAEGGAVSNGWCVGMENAGIAVLRSPVQMPGIMRSRTPGERGRALTKSGAGGSDATVMRALRWLKTVQNDDGSWPGHPVASTALALWCYFEHLEIPWEADDSEFGRTIVRGLEFLAGDVDPVSGLFRSARGEPLAQPLGALALAMGHQTTLGLSFRENGGRTLPTRLREAAESALRPILAGQRSDGAWNADPIDPSPAGRGDPRTTFWCTLALCGGRILAHDLAPFPEWQQGAKDALAAFLDPAADAALRPDGTATPVTAAVIFGLQRLGRFKDSAVKRGIGALAGCVFSWEAWDGPQPWGESGTPVRDWFFVTNAKFECGGEVFHTWNKQFLPEVIGRQIVVPAEQSGYRNVSGTLRDIGWWDSPSETETGLCSGGPVLPCKRWRDGECVDGETTLGDRVRDTSLSALPMMIYYAFLPIYRRGNDSEFLETAPPKTNGTNRVIIRRHAAPTAKP